MEFIIGHTSLVNSPPFSPSSFPGCRLAGAAGTTLTCPLEVVKTRLQVRETLEDVYSFIHVVVCFPFRVCSRVLARMLCTDLSLGLHRWVSPPS